METRLFKFIGGACSVLLLFAAVDIWACGQSGSTTITNLPTLGGSVFQGSAFNGTGQLTGFSYTTGNLAAHAIIYGGGVLNDLGTLGGVVSQGHAINAQGQVAGESYTSGNLATHAFLFSSGGLFDLGTLGGSTSSAKAINNAGQVTGDSLLQGDSVQEGFLYFNGSLTNLGTLGGDYSSPAAINNAGVIVGDSYTANDAEFHGFIYTNGTMSDLGTLGGDYSSGRAINDAGLIAGESYTTNGDTHAFLYSGGVMSDLGTLGGTYSTALAINQTGQILGTASTTNDLQYHAFLYGAGTMTDLSTLGGDYSNPQAFNNLGQVVGDSAISNGNAHAFLWQNGAMTDLNNLLPTNSNWVLTEASFINDAGQIVGSGFFNGNFSWFIMTLASANNPPVANAGQDQSVECQTAVTLDASHSSDPDGDALTYQWSENGATLGTNSTLTATFDPGTHTITLTVTDPCGASSQTNVLVHVTDAVSPTVTCPGPTSASADANCQAPVPNVTLGVIARDNCTATGLLIITQNPAPGTLVGLGQHAIVVTVTDAAGNSNSCSSSFTVVDTTPPVIVGGPAPIIVSADANCQGAAPNVVAGIVASDNCTPANKLTITQNPVAGTFFGLGQHPIIVTVTDAAGNSTAGSTSFTVADTTPPVIVSSPGPITVSTGTKCSAIIPNVVSGIVASDNCTPSNQLTITQNPPAGTIVDTGTRTILVTVTDAAGNTSTRNIMFTAADTVPPVIVSLPGPITISADANGQGVVPDVTSGVVATDHCTPANLLVVTQSPVAGSTVGLGTQLITVTVTDASGNSTSRNVKLKVVDQTPPVIVSVPAPITAPAGANGRAVVPDVASSIVAFDNCTPANLLIVTQSPSAGSHLGLGTYLITIKVKDAAGNIATAEVSFTVVDTTPPVIRTVTASPKTLTPSNNQMVPVTVSVGSVDNCDNAPVNKITSITCNEPAAPGDVQIIGDLNVNLAASRTATGNGRVYTITVQSTDASGNSSTATTTVTVPAPKGRNK